MADLLDFFEREIDTDFALLTAAQPAGAGNALTDTYAASAPGTVALACGTKYAEVRIRLERWDERPPWVGDDWQDCDELPYEEIPDDGPLSPFGFDFDDPAGLDLGGLGRARVRVLARGRHRYHYGDHREGLPREEWLLQFWPDPERRDALGGPPRRLGRPLLLRQRRSPWRAALHSWNTTGWHHLLRGHRAYEEIRWSLERLGRACDRDEIASPWGPWQEARQRHGRYTWSTPVQGFPPPFGEPPSIAADREASLARLSNAMRVPTIITFDDLWTGMRSAGLILAVKQSTKDMFVPNPAPVAVWDLLQMDESWIRSSRQAAAELDFRELETDIQHLVRWAPAERLAATPGQIALRLALHPDDILGVIRLLSDKNQVVVEPELNDVAHDTEIVIKAWTRA